MRVQAHPQPVDIVMAGTFAAWRLGTLQARALPFARELLARGVRCAIVTVPWDMPSEAGVTDTISNVEIRNTAATSVMSLPFAVAQQARLIHSFQPRAVHVFKPKGYGGLAGRLRPHGVPLVVDSDDWEGDGGWNQAGNYSVLQRRLFGWQERTLLQSATAVTAASHLLSRRALSMRSATPETVTWVPNGLEQDWASQLARARRRQNDSDNTPTILLYSRFAEFASDWLPRYASQLSESLPDDVRAQVVIVGDAPSMSGIGGANISIDQMGYVAQDQLPSILGSADIAIFPYADSLIARSKNSVKLLELMTAGCAVIASRIGDVPAVAGDAVVLIDTSSPEAFAATTVELLRNRPRIRGLSTAAQERAINTFTIGTVTDRLVRAYRSAGVLSACSTG